MTSCRFSWSKTLTFEPLQAQATLQAQALRACGCYLSRKSTEHMGFLYDFQTLGILLRMVSWNLNTMPFVSVIGHPNPHHLRIWLLMPRERISETFTAWVFSSNLSTLTCHVGRFILNVRRPITWFRRLGSPRTSDVFQFLSWLRKFECFPRWWCQHIFILPLPVEIILIWRAYFSNGLKPPTSFPVCLAIA